MKKITLTLGVVALFSSCGIQFGNYEKWRQINKPSMCQEKLTKDHWVANDCTKHTGQIEDYYVERENDFTSGYDCENCDEID